MANLSGNDGVSVRVYHGYGHTNDLVVYGHVLQRKPVTRKNYTNHVLANILHLVRMFFVKPVPGAQVELHWRNQVLYSTTEADGFFKFEWKSDEQVEAGWHSVTVNYKGEDGQSAATGSGTIFVPHTTQYAFISDIDDTVMISYSATIGKRLKVLFTGNPHTRRTFTGVVDHYNRLAFAHTGEETPNPFFYVSSSEWNLYDDLNEFFTYNKLPEGAFLLSQLKQWFELVKTGKTKHEGKLLRVLRILKTFPRQTFVLLGDNSQSDPSIYASIAGKYPQAIYAVYIRNIRPENEVATREILASIEKEGVYTCLFTDSAEAMQHSKQLGLIH